MLYIK